MFLTFRPFWGFGVVGLCLGFLGLGFLGRGLRVLGLSVKGLGSLWLFWGFWVLGRVMFGVSGVPFGFQKGLVFLGFRAIVGGFGF